MKTLTFKDQQGNELHTEHLDFADRKLEKIYSMDINLDCGAIHFFRHDRAKVVELELEIKQLKNIISFYENKEYL